MPIATTNQTTEIATMVDLQKYFSSDAPSEMIFIYLGDLVKYSCTKDTFHHNGKDITDLSKVFKVNDTRLYITKIYKNRITIGRYMLGKSINFSLLFDEIKPCKK